MNKQKLMMKQVKSVLIGLMFIFELVICADLKFKTFLSPPIVLKSGQIANTPSDWGPLPWIDEPIAIRHFHSDVVDANNKTVPESELYVHHWLIFNGESKQDVGVCSNLASIFGIGAELRGVDYDFPSPYGILSTSTLWTANLHFIRVTNVPDVQECIECRCPDSNPPLHPHGEVGCCIDQAMCWSMENSTLNDPKPYFLQYTIGYEPITPEIIPLSIFYFDVTAKNTTDCEIQYDVPALKPGQIHTKSSVSIFPTNMTVKFVELHQHIGALNMSVDHFRNGKFLNSLCAQAPIYTDDYLTDIPTCAYPETYELLEGDELHITSLYTSRTIAGGHPWHSGVMGIVYIAGVASPLPQQVCIDRLHKLCGAPPYKTEKSCTDCALKHSDDLKDFRCTDPMVGDECRKTDSEGNIPPPDQVHDMTLRSRTIGDRNFFNITAPAGAWFGFGGGATHKPVMTDAEAWIYCNDEETHKPVLQHRRLGNHNAGYLINRNIPANVTTVDGIVTLQFEMTPTSSLSAPAMAGTCILFAQGNAGSMDFNYHGSTRGSTCY